MVLRPADEGSAIAARLKRRKAQRHSSASLYDIVRLDGRARSFSCDAFGREAYSSAVT